MPPKRRSTSRTPSRGRRSASRGRTPSRSHRAASPKRRAPSRNTTATKSPPPSRRHQRADASDMEHTPHSTVAAAALVSRGERRSTSKLFILAQMLVCVAGIYVCFSAWSLKQERLMTMPYSSSNNGKPDAFFPTVFGVSLAQSVAGALVAAIILSGSAVVCRLQEPVQHQQNKEKTSPRHGTRSHEDQTQETMGLAEQAQRDMRALLVVGFANAFGATLGYASMRRLSFPVVLATKMSKVVPVMAVGLVCYGTRYSWRKVLSCAAITLGIVCFYLLEDPSATSRGGGSAKKAASGHNVSGGGGIGFLLLAANLFLDGFSNSTQDVLVRRRGWTATALMFAANTAAALWSLAVMLLLDSSSFSRLATSVLPSSVVSTIAFGDLTAALQFLRTHPAAQRDLLGMSVLNAVGQIFIFQTITLFGTLTLTAMTLVRKAGSVLLSIFVNGHSISKPQWAALGLVMGSVVFEAHVNVSETAEKRKREQREKELRDHKKRD